MKKTVIHCKRSQSQNVVPYEALPEMNLLQAGVPSQKNTRGAENVSFAAWLLGPPDQRDLTCVQNCYYHCIPSWSNASVPVIFPVKEQHEWGGRISWLTEISSQTNLVLFCGDIHKTVWILYRIQQCDVMWCGGISSRSLFVQFSIYSCFL